MTSIKLIIGLGNPGEEYENTRHNIGFMMLDYIAKKADCDDFEFNKKLNAMTVKGKLDETAIVLVKPQSFVNKTGEVAGKAKNFYKVKPADIVLIHDDLDIPFGNTKLSFGKNSGGHKGVESVIRTLKTKDFHRLRMGLAKRSLAQARQQSDKKRDQFVMNLVLSKFSKPESEDLKKIFKEGYEKILQLG